MRNPTIRGGNGVQISLTTALKERPLLPPLIALSISKASILVLRVAGLNLPSARAMRVISRLGEQSVQNPAREASCHALGTYLP
jgi:hypothetical protein